MIVKKIHQIISLLGIDQSILFTLLARLVGIFSGIINIYMLAHFFSKNEQGYYYTFISIFGAQIFFELGLSYVILQFASHEMVKLQLGNQIIVGDLKSKDRLASLFHFLVRWYSRASIIIFIFVFIGGYYFFAYSQKINVNVDWRAPWLLFVIVSSILIILYSFYSFLEGCGFVKQISRFRFYQTILSNLFFWLFIILNFRLYSLAVLKGVELLIGIIAILYNYRKLLYDLFLHYKKNKANKINWKKEILPFQWKIAVSWLSGYFIFQIFSPILFVYQGPVVSGQMGMTLNIINSLGAIPMVWISTKIPTWGKYVAQKKYNALDSSFFKTFVQSYCILILISVIVLAGSYILSDINPNLRQRILDAPSLVLLLLTNLFNYPVFAQATYLRAHKKEPFLLTSITCGGLISISTLFMAKYYSVREVVGSYFVINFLISFVIGSIIFFKKRKEWHGVA